MSGLGKTEYAFVAGGAQVAQRDIDQYDLICVDNPSVNASWYGTVAGGTVSTNAAFTKINQLADWPRNVLYSVTGVASGTFGGTFIANLVDQFGSAVTETVVVPSAVVGGSVFGTAIAMKFLSGTFQSTGASGGSTGTASIGFGTIEGGSSQTNWFGLLTKLGGTADVKNITWIASTTVTTLNGGTSIGTLVNTSTHSFQGTSGVTATDHYRVVLKATFDNTSFGTMSGL